MGDKLPERIKKAFFTFVTFVGTVWNFIFLKTPDSDESDLQSNEHFFETDVRFTFITVKNEGSHTEPVF